MHQAAILIFALVVSGCSDFSSSLGREDDGSLRDQTLWLVTDAEQRVHAPGDERIQSAWADDPGVAEVREIDDDHLVLVTHSPGTTMLNLSTDAAPADAVNIEVRFPDEIAFDHSPPRWIATTGKFSVGYDLMFEGQNLDGAGFKAVVGAPGLSVREVPLTLEQVGLFGHGWTRKLEVGEGRAGTFAMTTALGGELEVLRVEPHNVEEIDVEAGQSDGEVGDERTIEIIGRVDGEPVLGFDGFTAKSKTGRICATDDVTSSTVGWVTQVEFRKSGECRIRIKNRDADWERDFVYRVN